MPTPSSNPPPDPSSSPSYNFSTCPDDLQLPPRSARESQDAPRPQAADDMEVRRDESIHDTAPTVFDATVRGGDAIGDVAALEDQTSAEPSSRGTTMSPRPQSSATSLMSPPPTTGDADTIKRQDACDALLSPESAPAATQRVRGNDLTQIDREMDSSDLPMYDETSVSPSISLEYSSKRAIPVSPSSYLRPGSRFHGTQQSERQVYDVQVEIKHVDMRESFLCGYLRIQGLTEDHPTLTTYFEGEIIGTKYSFFTQHDDWGANSRVDLSHWARFSAFRPFQKLARKGPVTIPDVSQKDTIFMRWKEHFLVPDHRVRTITGASFEGFYYICFNQLKGEVSGIYFHSKSEKFQQLELKHVPDRGCFSATEFR